MGLVTIPDDNIFGIKGFVFEDKYSGAISNYGTFSGAYFIRPFGIDTPITDAPYYVLVASAAPPVQEGYSWGTFSFENKVVYLCAANVPPGVSTPPVHNTMPGTSIPWWGYTTETAQAAWLMIYGGYFSGFDVTYDLVDCIGDSGNPTTIRPNAAITNANFYPDDTDPSVIFAFNSGSCWIDGEGFIPGTPVEFVWDYENGHLQIGAISTDIIIHIYAYGDPYAELDVNGEEDIPGSDTISLPSLPSLTTVSAGVIGLFAPSSAQMRALADYMWTDFGGSGTTTEDILKEIVQALKRTISNPLDYIVGLNIIPSAGLSIGSSSVIRFGFVSSDVSMPRLSSQYFTVDCGSIAFNTICGNTFLDYAPYSKFSIYLPYIGFKDVDANDFVGHSIRVMYRGDVVTGAVTAYILKDNSVMYQYSGCCALNVPLTADSWGATIAGAMQIASSIVAAAGVSNSAGIAKASVDTVASVAGNPSLLSPKVMHSGAVSGGAGALGVQIPFVIREAVRFHSTNGFNTISGYPSYYYRQLSNVHGFTVCYDVHLHGISATSDELEEIEKLLKEGVIL